MSTYTLDRDLNPIMRGDVALPNPEPIEHQDVGAVILHYDEMHGGTALLPNGQKSWNVKFFLDRGQGSQLYGSGIVAWTKWDNEKRTYVATGLRFAICKHEKKEGAGANHSRGWHPGSCVKCGLDMTIDSGD
jgi:hypothetical protein